MQGIDVRQVATEGAGPAQSLDPFEIFKLLDTTSRAALVADIVGHPKGSPSKTELDHMNPNLAPSTISEFLGDLADAGIIGSVTRDRSGLEPDEVYKFFYLTKAARSLFDEVNVFGEDGYSALYEQVERSAIEDAEEATRPDFPEAAHLPRD